MFIRSSDVVFDGPWKVLRFAKQPMEYSTLSIKRTYRIRNAIPHSQTGIKEKGVTQKAAYVHVDLGRTRQPYAGWPPTQNYHSVNPTK